MNESTCNDEIAALRSSARNDGTDRATLNFEPETLNPEQTNRYPSSALL